MNIADLEYIEEIAKQLKLSNNITDCEALKIAALHQQNLILCSAFEAMNGGLSTLEQISMVMNGDGDKSR